MPHSVTTSAVKCYVSEPMVQNYYKFLGFQNFLTYFENCIGSESDRNLKKIWEDFSSRIYSTRSNSPSELVQYANCLILFSILDYKYYPANREYNAGLTHLSFVTRFITSLDLIFERMKIIWLEIRKYFFELIQCSSEHIKQAGYLPRNLKELFSFILRENCPSNALDVLLNMWSPLTYEFCLSKEPEINQRILTKFLERNNLIQLFQEPLNEIRSIYFKDQSDCFKQVREIHTYTEDTVLYNSVNKIVLQDQSNAQFDKGGVSDLELLDIIMDDAYHSNEDIELSKQQLILSNQIPELVYVEGFLLQQNPELCMYQQNITMLKRYDFDFIFMISNFIKINFLNREKVIFYTQSSTWVLKERRPGKVFRFLVRKFTRIKHSREEIPCAA